MPIIARYFKPLPFTFVALTAAASLGCSDEPAASAGASGGVSDQGVELAVPVPDAGRAFVDLKAPAVVTESGDGSTSTDWDIAFEGYEVYTNSGLSGPGQGGALGPYGPDIYVSGKDPASPIITVDTIGGAFLRWYAYDYTNPAHALYSRYHVFGLRDKDRLWKVQILSYYGEVNGAPVSAMYRLRYAELFSGAPAGPTTEISNVDGTAGGPTGTDQSTSGCLDLATGMQTALDPKEAETSSAWQLCFRRETIEVNGELGGPRGVVAVDLDVDKTPAETYDEVTKRTAESELAHFEEVTYEALSDPGLAYRGDRVVSIFADQWLAPAGSGDAPTPLPATWVVVHAADGESRALVTISRFEGAGAKSPGKVILGIKPVMK